MRLGGLLQPGDLICLQGELGAGKTTLVQGMAQGWGSLDAVSSPTFILVNEYRRPNGGQFFHMDAYRLESGLEAAELDLDLMLGEGALVVEWPERISSVLPSTGPTLRTVTTLDACASARVTQSGLFVSPLA